MDLLTLLQLLEIRFLPFQLSVRNYMCPHSSCTHAARERHDAVPRCSCACRGDSPDHAGKGDLHEHRRGADRQLLQGLRSSHRSQWSATGTFITSSARCAAVHSYSCLQTFLEMCQTGKLSTSWCMQWMLALRLFGGILSKRDFGLILCAYLLDLCFRTMTAV